MATRPLSASCYKTPRVQAQLSGTAAAWLTVARAQSSERMRRIGAVMSYEYGCRRSGISRPPFRACLSPLAAGLNALHVAVLSVGGGARFGHDRPGRVRGSPATVRPKRDEITKPQYT